MLDRALGNPWCRNLFTEISVSSSAICSSDHNPFVITLSIVNSNLEEDVEEFFKYEASWGHKVEC